MDALTAVLDRVHVTGAAFSRSVMSAPWAVRFADRAPLAFVAVVRGTAWLVPDDGDPVRLSVGDRALVSGGRGFALTDDPSSRTPPAYVVTSPEACTDAAGRPLPADALLLGTRTCGERPDGEHAAIAGAIHVVGPFAERLIAGLPPVLVVEGGASALSELALIEQEIDRDAPGQQVVLDRLLDLLLLATLRDWAPDGLPAPPSWRAGLADPVVSAGLRAIHTEPHRAWTVASLASEAAVSRAAFARRFTEAVGAPPISYLSAWRLDVAADLLEQTDATLDVIAREVGYSDAYALSAAFTRRFGTRPTAYRAAVRAGRG